MFGGLGGEGTNQEGCRTQQVADLQYVAIQHTLGHWTPRLVRTHANMN